MSVASGGDDPRGNDDDLASVADLLETLIDELRARVQKNEDDRIGPITRSVEIDAVLPEVEGVLAACPDSSHVRIARVCVSSRQHREELGDPDSELITVDELTALVIVLKALRIEQDRRKGKKSREDTENTGSRGFGHDWRGSGQSEPNRPRYSRRPKKQRVEPDGTTLELKG